MDLSQRHEKLSAYRYPALLAPDINTQVPMLLLDIASKAEIQPEQLHQ